MKSTKITYIFLAFIAILMWNGMLIKRDQKMFDAYEKQSAMERLKHPPSNSLKTWCERQAGSHPDCDVE